MPHLVFIAKERPSSCVRLVGPTTLGRSLDGDIYVPDVFLSRQHCRFEPMEDGWSVVDTNSVNGLYMSGKRIYRRMLQPGDQLEIGTFVVRFEERDIPAELSTPTPFGEGPAITSLVDTVYAADMRPTDFLKRSREKQKPSWVRAREAAEEEARRKREAELAEAREQVERLNFSDGIELDLELQIATAAEEMGPAFVLVPRELAAKMYAAVQGGVAGPVVGSPARALEGVDVTSKADADSLEALLPYAAGHGHGSDSPARAASAATTIMASPGAAPKKGYGDPADRLRSMWNETLAEAEAAKNADKLTPREKKKLEKEAKAKAKEQEKEQKQKEKEKERPKVDIYKPTMSERLDEWREALKGDVTFGAIAAGAVERIKQNPMRTAIAGLAASLIIGGVTYWKMTENPYKIPPSMRDKAYTRGADN